MEELFRYIEHSFVRTTTEDKSIHVGDDSIKPSDLFQSTNSKTHKGILNDSIAGKSLVHAEISFRTADREQY